MLIVANWKAYVQSENKAKKLFAAAKRLTTHSSIEIILAAPAPYLGVLAPSNRSKVLFAAQDISSATGGAETGEVTAAMFRDLGVTHTIIGHSERRALGDTDVIVSEKVRNAFGNKLVPIVCIGERERDVDAKYLGLLRSQIHAVFQPLSPKERQQTILAYEPIWAIGKSADNALTASDLTEMVLYIRKILGEYLPGNGASKIKLMYGGSVEPGNIKSHAQDTGVDGFLVGHASADADVFTALVKALK